MKSIPAPAFHTPITFKLAIATLLMGLLTPSLRAADSRQILKQIGVSRGICAIVGKNAAPLAVELANASELIVYVQSPTESDTLAARRNVEKAGLLGSRVYVERGSRETLNLADNLADAVIVLNPTASIDSLKGSGLAVALHPRGRLIAGDQVWTKPAPDGEGSWSHPYHGPDNNPQSTDKLAVGPYLTKFLAEPYYGPMPEVTVSAGGRMFKAFGHISFKKREWAMLNSLAAFNAYNGTLLWRRELAPGFMIHRNTIVATDDTLFLGDNDSCKLIAAATGELKREIKFNKSPGWKWMALEGGILYALLGDKEPIDETLHGIREKSGWPWSGMGKMYDKKVDYKWGFGKTLVAIDPSSGGTLWTREYKSPSTAGEWR